jgi:hypothetical protein
MDDSFSELRLANTRTRERLTDTVHGIRRKTDVPERWRLFRARTRQQMHRDPTPLVAMMIAGAAGVATIVVGTRIARKPAGRLDAADIPMQTFTFAPKKPAKISKKKQKKPKAAS